jgi:hypothetical protein
MIFKVPAPAFSELRPQVAKAADNVGCEPPQIPLSKPLKTKGLQAAADWDAI